MSQEQTILKALQVTQQKAGRAIPMGGRMKYRNKPVVIDAMQFDGYEKTANEISNALGGSGIFETGHKGGSLNGILVFLFIKTPEGRVRADVGDWIIKGVNGELYPCKPDIFAATYEPDEAA